MFTRLLFASFIAMFTSAAPIKSQIVRTEGCASIINNEYNYLFCENPQSWLGAQTYCQLNGGDLLSIQNAEESKWIKQQRNETNTLNTDAWITLETNNFVFWDWNLFSPSAIHNMNCARVLAVSNVIEDTSCNELLNFICEIPYVSTSITTSTPHTTTTTPELPNYMNSAYYEPLFILFFVLIIILIIIRVQMRSKYINSLRVIDIRPPTLPPIQLVENHYAKPAYAKPAYAKPAYAKPDYAKPSINYPPLYSEQTDEVPQYVDPTTSSSNYAYMDVVVLPEAYLPEAYLPEAYLPEAYLPEAYLPEDIPETHTYIR